MTAADAPLTADETLATLADSVAEYFAWDDNDGRSQHLAAHLLAAVESILSARLDALHAENQRLKTRNDELFEHREMWREEAESQYAYLQDVIKSTKSRKRTAALIAGRDAARAEAQQLREELNRCRNQ